MCPQGEEDKKELSMVPYAFAADSLMYAMLCTTLGIAYTFIIVSRFQANPEKEHWIAVKSTLKS